MGVLDDIEGSGKVNPGSPMEKLAEERELKEIAEAEPQDEEDRANLISRIQRMTVSERIKLALLGNKEVRTILIRDPVKSVQVAVIQNPRITETEVERIAASRNVDEEVLRLILKNRNWTKLYPVKVALVKNPKTPIKESLRLLSHLRERELKEVAASKNLPNPVIVAAKKLLSERNP
jgi:hypothetical protein